MYSIKVIYLILELGEKAQEIYTSGTGNRKGGKGNRPDIRSSKSCTSS